MVIKNILEKQKEKDQNLVALHRIPHQVFAKSSSFGFVLAEKEPVIITRPSLRKKTISELRTNVYRQP